MTNFSTFILLLVLFTAAESRATQDLLVRPDPSVQLSHLGGASFEAIITASCTPDAVSDLVVVRVDSILGSHGPTVAATVPDGYVTPSFSWNGTTWSVEFRTRFEWSSSSVGAETASASIRLRVGSQEAGWEEVVPFYVVRDSNGTFTIDRSSFYDTVLPAEGAFVASEPPVRLDGSEADALARGGFGYGEQESGLTSPSAPTAHDQAFSCSAASGTSGLAALLPSILALFVLRRRRSRAAGLVVLLAALGASSSASAVTRYAYGNLSFWDTRDFMSNVTGTRLPTCNAADYTCSVGSANCCIRPVPYLKIQLQKYQGGVLTTVDTVTSAPDGYFFLTEPNWSSTASYQFHITFEGGGTLINLKLRPDATSSAYTYTIGSITLPSTFNSFPSLNMNSYGDTSSTLGDLASVWTTITEVAADLNGDGETRYQREYGSTPGTLDQIVVKVPSGSNGASDCDDSTISLPDSQTRDRTPAHEFGHLLHGRLVGCSGNNRPFPPLWANMGHVQHASEVSVITEAYGNFFEVYSRRNPATLGPLQTWANYPSIKVACNDGETEGAGGACATNANCQIGQTCIASICTWSSFINGNNLSGRNNNTAVIWELLDSDTTSDNAASDNAGVLITDFNDALVALASTSGSVGQNRTKDEFYKTSQATACVRNEHCAAGEVCDQPLGVCYAGDPHGCNMRDIVSHLATVTGVAVGTLTDAMVSSPCVLPLDDTYPYQGGYRWD